LHQCQVDPNKYRDISSGFGVLLQEQGLGGFFKGWMATLVGYSSQGACKFGFYEYFKKCYSDIAGPENADRLKTVIYLAASASAEVIADIALCPMEAVKVRIQTQPGFARCLTDGLPKLVQSEGAFGYRFCMSCIVYCVKICSSQGTSEHFLTPCGNFRLYKGILPLWGRQIPCESNSLPFIFFHCMCMLRIEYSTD
jgi:solute carrier family 25 phosphate transporter 3